MLFWLVTSITLLAIGYGIRQYAARVPLHPSDIYSHTYNRYRNPPKKSYYELSWTVVTTE